MAAKAKARKDAWPCRTGEPGACFATENVGPNPSEGMWSWRPGGCYDGILLDGEGHIFVVMRGSRIVMWRLDLWTSPRYFSFEGVSGTPAISAGVLYAVAWSGTAAAFNVKSGEELWKKKFCGEVPQDPLSVGVNGDVVLATGAAEERPAGSAAPVICDTVYGLYAKDGTKLWKYVPGMMLQGQNFTPALMDDVVVFTNSKADVCCLKLRDGSEQWKAVPKGVGRSLGGAIVGRNRLVYVAANRPGKKLWNHPSGGKGTVRAYELKSGTLKWEKEFDLETHAVPSLLSTGPGGKLVLAVGMGATPGFPEGNSFGLAPTGDQWEAQIVGLNPETGEQLWTTERMTHYGQGCLKSDENKDLVVNAVTNPVSGGDGTFYYVWQGQIFQCSVEDGTQKSHYNLMDPVQTNVVIGPGFMVVAGCFMRMGVFRANAPMRGKVIRPLDVPLEETGTDHFWAAKHGHNMDNQGFTEKYKGPRSLLKPVAFWKWGSLYSNRPRWPDDNLYNSPSVDAQRNTYVAANFSDLFIIRPDGTLRGSMYLGPLVSTPVLLGKNFYISDGAGFATSVDIETLTINWRKKYCESNPWDSWSVAAVEGALITGGNMDFRINGAMYLFRLNTSDGEVVWKTPYPGMEEYNVMPYNMMPGITNGRIITANNQGYVFCHDFETGEILWSTPVNEQLSDFTTATVVVGKNGLAANAWNSLGAHHWNTNQGGAGKLDVYEVQSGLKKWETIYTDFDINVAPLFLPPEVTEGSSGWQVVVCLGSNPGPPFPGHIEGNPSGENVSGDCWKGLMLAHDAETGEEIWGWAPPPSKRFAFRGSDATDWYLPDAWTSVSSDCTGTIYGSFHDGVIYAVKGGELVSKFDMRSCANCAPGIAPGFVCTMNQHGLLIWRDRELEDEWAASGDKRAVGGKLPGGPIPDEVACGGPWDDGRLEWVDPFPFNGKEKTTAVDIADHDQWIAETERLHKESLAVDREWSEARKAERAEALTAGSGGGLVWVVIGGTAQGGITVRKGENLKSDDLGRIATGAKVRQLELKGDRLHFQKVSGGGPDEGWVSLSFKGSPLVRRED